MTTMITSTCGQCRQSASMPAEAVLLDLDARTLSWVCAHCGDLEEQKVTAALLPRLVDSGVSLISSRNARPTGHPESPPAGDPLTLDDLLGLHELLGQPVWFQELERLVRAVTADTAADAA